MRRVFLCILTKCCTSWCWVLLQLTFIRQKTISHHFLPIRPVWPNSCRVSTGPHHTVGQALITKLTLRTDSNSKEYDLDLFFEITRTQSSCFWYTQDQHNISSWSSMDKFMICLNFSIYNKVSWTYYTKYNFKVRTKFNLFWHYAVDFNLLLTSK